VACRKVMEGWEGQIGDSLNGGTNGQADAFERKGFFDGMYTGLWLKELVIHCNATSIASYPFALITACGRRKNVVCLAAVEDPSDTP
jgi:hypothetical protein